MQPSYFCFCYFRAIAWTSILDGILTSICAYAGLIIFAFYYNCDPISTGQVDSKDQLFPLFVLQVIHWVSVIIMIMIMMMIFQGMGDIPCVSVIIIMIMMMMILQVMGDIPCVFL